MKSVLKIPRNGLCAAVPILSRRQFTTGVAALPLIGVSRLVAAQSKTRLRADSSMHIGGILEATID